jgi:hypothetical protein
MKGYTDCEEKRSAGPNPYQNVSDPEHHAQKRISSLTTP